MHSIFVFVLTRPGWSIIITLWFESCILRQGHSSTQVLSSSSAFTSILTTHQFILCDNGDERIWSDRCINTCQLYLNLPLWCSSSAVCVSEKTFHSDGTHRNRLTEWNNTLYRGLATRNSFISTVIWILHFLPSSSVCTSTLCLLFFCW